MDSRWVLFMCNLISEGGLRKISPATSATVLCAIHCLFDTVSVNRLTIEEVRICSSTCAIKISLLMMRKL